ncbi:hypothetical protein DPMN_165431 [Dreissena polymorpha]|uniref:Uncharacterized protein n=1 Tax=Dreissena polymorpha TaxID=45954 RepID=A0A9D4IUK9_DREPO|nr:hypothetical protein DPMN_165431 [Dreissena polymorpha]
MLNKLISLKTGNRSVISLNFVIFKVKYIEYTGRSKYSRCPEYTGRSKYSRCQRRQKWTVRAWQATQASTIQKCSRACGFTVETTETSDDEYPDNNIPLADLVLHFRFQLNELTSLDTDVETHDSEWEADIVNCYREDAADAADAANPADANDHVDQTQEETPEVPPVTLKEIRDFSLRLQWNGHETDGDFLATSDTLINSSEIKIVKQKCALKQ